MESYIYHSSDFQCPASGVPIWLIYNEDTGMITAEICEFVYPLVPEENEFYDEKSLRKQKIGVIISMNMQKILTRQMKLQKYDCWF